MITVNEDIGVEIEAKVNAEAEIDAFVFIGSGGTPDGIDGGEADTEFPEPTEDPWLSQIQIRRDVLADWVSANPVLRFGEFGFVSDEKYLVIGDGASDFNTIVGDDENIYETKKYVDDLVDNVYNTYDFVIGELISASSQHESALSTSISTEASARASADSALSASIPIFIDIKTSSDTTTSGMSFYDVTGLAVPVAAS